MEKLRKSEILVVVKEHTWRLNKTYFMVDSLVITQRPTWKKELVFSTGETILETVVKQEREPGSRAREVKCVLGLKEGNQEDYSWKGTLQCLRSRCSLQWGL